MLLLEKLEQKRKYMILIMVLCILIGFAYCLFGIDKKNTVESVLMLIEIEEKNEDSFTSKGNLDLTEKMVSNFEEIITSDTTIMLLSDDIKSKINLNDLKDDIKVESNSNSDTFKIIVENQNPDNALKINENLIEIFSEKIKSIFENTDIYVVDYPHIEENINYPQIIKIMIISIFIGIFVNILYINCLTEIDKKVKKSNDLEKELSLKNLGNVPVNKSKNNLISQHGKNQYDLAFKNLRSNIQFINVGNKEKNTIFITSPKKLEGKTTIATNIAIAFANTGKKVILIDTNMNNGNIANVFNIPNDSGLSNYLSGIDENGIETNERINKFIKDTLIKNLNIITSGIVPPNSSELLSMPKFEDTIKDLSVFYDVIIFDGTSVLNETDSLILARLANSTIIVTNYRKTKKDDLWHAKRDIQNVGGRIIGIVINKVKEKKNQKIKNVKKLLKDKYCKLKNYIITKRNEKKQKLLEAAIIEEKQKNSQELKAEESKFLEEVQKEDLKIKKENTKENVKEFEEKLSSIISKVKEKTELEEEKIKKAYQMAKETVKNKIAKIIETEKNKTSEINKTETAKDKITKNETTVKDENAKKETVKTEVAQNEIIPKKLIKQEIVQEKLKKDENDALKFKNKEEQEKMQLEKDENNVLVIVDAENGYCRAFSKSCFTEKLIRGIDKTDGFVKANYSLSSLNREKTNLMIKYELSKEQANRIDTLIYSVLKSYDECVWIEKKMVSTKADDYVICMAKEYEKNENETNTNYKLRCQYLRKVELIKCQIEIEYKLDSLWSSNQINITDKIAFYNFAKKYENLKERRKKEAKEKSNAGNTKIGNPINNIFKKIKFEEVKIKSVEELAKEVTESQKKNDEYENYRFEDYQNNNLGFEEEQDNLLSQEEILIEQLRKKQVEKDRKNQEKNERKKEKDRKRKEQRKNKELKRQKAKEEARIEEELLVDNLYPKTKNNKNL